MKLEKCPNEDAQTAGDTHAILDASLATPDALEMKKSAHYFQTPKPEGPPCKVP